MSNESNDGGIKSILYFLLGIYTVIINWHYNHSIVDAFFAWIFWPVYLVYSCVVGNLAHHAWYDIPAACFN